MKFIQNNLAYLILGIIAVVLIFVTISLQAAILSTQNNDPAANDGFLSALGQQLSGWLAPAEGSVADTVPVTGGSGAAPPNNSVEPLGEIDILPSQDTSAITTPNEPLAASAEEGTDPASTDLDATASALANAENLTVSEDDDIIATVIGSNPLSVGFFGYAYYLRYQDRLRTIAIRLPDGQLVGPNVTSVANGLYPLARPLLLYTSPTVLREKPEVEAFLGCYLNQLPQVVNATGYLLPSRTLFEEAIQSFNAVCQRCRREESMTHPLATNVPACDLTGISGNTISIVGSSTVAPISRGMAALVTERGFAGEIQVDGSGTGAGFRNFCETGTGEIVDASRPIKDAERTACRDANRSVLPFPVAVDALAIVVNRENTFLQEASIEELQQIFAYARRWSDINPNWPSAAIERVIPGLQSGTFDYFVEAVMEGGALTDQVVAPLTDSTAQEFGLVSTPTSEAVGSGAFINNQPNVRLGYLDRGAGCVETTQLAELILQRKFGLTVTTVPFADADTLYAMLSSRVPEERIDLTFCYMDPTDRTYRQRYFSYTDFIGSGYQETAFGRFVIMTNNIVREPLRRSNACLFHFLAELSLDQIDLGQQDPNTWYGENQTMIDAWVTCG